MSGIFFRTGFFNDNISKENVSNITDMNYMFTGVKLCNQDLS
ncbi:BspA family leucine-rich repeat surface protein [Spiroplasma endosymbiont of Polydrusus pterygomalis]